MGGGEKPECFEVLRLLIENAQVSVLDFKTGRVPESDVQIPAAHRAQMQAYSEALRVIFPPGTADRKVDLSLI